jgi:hypothetical protein
MSLNLSPPNAYYGLAVAHVQNCVNVCVLKKEHGQSQIVKNDELSWREEDPKDLGHCYDEILGTIQDVSRLQTAAQAHLHPCLRFEMNILSGMHDTPSEFIDSELSRIKIYPETVSPIAFSTKERKAGTLIHNRILAAIEAQQIEDFLFGTEVGTYSFPDKEGFEKVSSDLKALHEQAVKGDLVSMFGLKLYGIRTVKNSVKHLRDSSPLNQLAFIQLLPGIGEYLNLPEVIAEMRAEIRRQGLDPDMVDIKFPSDERSDYYFNVLRPVMDVGIREFESNLQDPDFLTQKMLLEIMRLGIS